MVTPAPYCHRDPSCASALLEPPALDIGRLAGSSPLPAALTPVERHATVHALRLRVKVPVATGTGLSQWPPQRPAPLRRSPTPRTPCREHCHLCYAQGHAKACFRCDVLGLPVPNAGEPRSARWECRSRFTARGLPSRLPPGGTVSAIQGAKRSRRQPVKGRGPCSRRGRRSPSGPAGRPGACLQAAVLDHARAAGWVRVPARGTLARWLTRSISRRGREPTGFTSLSMRRPAPPT